MSLLSTQSTIRFQSEWSINQQSGMRPLNVEPDLYMGDILDEDRNGVQSGDIIMSSRSIPFLVVASDNESIMTIKFDRSKGQVGKCTHSVLDSAAWVSRAFRPNEENLDWKKYPKNTLGQVFTLAGLMESRISRLDVGVRYERPSSARDGSRHLYLLNADSPSEAKLVDKLDREKRDALSTSASIVGLVTDFSNSFRPNVITDMRYNGDIESKNLDAVFYAAKVCNALLEVKSLVRLVPKAHSR